MASLPPLLPRAVNRAQTFHGKIPERSKVNLTRARPRQRVYGDLRVNRKLIFDLQYLSSGNARWSVQVSCNSGTGHATEKPIAPVRRASV